MIKKLLSLGIFSVLFFSSCNNRNPQNLESISGNMEPHAELEKWKKELIQQKQIGAPCHFTAIGDSAYAKWQNENPEQVDGLPSDSTEFQSARADFDGDGKEDLLLYFQANNCTGHNGGVPSYAKIAYANGTSKNDLMSDIRTAIITQYNVQRAMNNRLKPISDNYLESTTTILFKEKINGICALYTEEDAHCCPSYEASYSYDVNSKKMDLKIKELE